MSVHPSRSFLAEAPTVPHALRLRAREHPDRPALAEPLGSGETLTYAQLDQSVSGFARRLRQLAPSGQGQQFAVIALPNTVDYVVSFLGCLAAGVVAVTLYPSTMSTARAARAFDTRLAGVVGDCAPFAIIGEAELMESYDDVIADGLVRMTPRAVEDPRVVVVEPALVHPSDVAMLQYTSGSTAAPKGVQLTHANLVHNVEAIAQGCGSADGEVIVSWLPLYHDMGLIGAVLHPLWAGMTVQLLTPSAFVRRPADWLRLVSTHRAAVVMAPNFAYELCLRRGRPGPGESWDLSSVRVALNGAEPVRPATVAAFNDVFGEHGFPPSALTPAYGLAENTVGVSFVHPAAGAPVFPATRSGLSQGRFEPAGSAAADRVDLVGCGTDLAGVTTAIVDPDTGVELPDGRVGEIWVSGDSVARGYHARPEETAARFRARIGRRHGDWLRTGDLGVRIEGQLCLCGRVKDLIIQNGANHDPADVEATSVSVDPRVAETAAAFSIFSDSGSDLVVLLQEVGRIDVDREADGLMTAIRSTVAEGHGLLLHAISLVPRGHLPKTTSGKVQRSRARSMWLEGSLDVLASTGPAHTQLAIGS